jgi:chemotaxis protein methyltransferase CheR
MNAEEFRLFRDLIYDHCGIFFQSDSAFLLHRRLLPRLEALSLADFTAYYRYLASASEERRRDEMEHLIERVTTNETYFFRESYQLDALAQEILPAIYRARPRGKRLTIWSAGCASGEEAYTIAIVLLEVGLFTDWEVRVFGNDISRRMLHIARKGQYGRSAFRATDPRLLRRYFREAEGKQQVRDEVRALVSFGQINLLDASMMTLVSEVDIIFCRNVLIYFDARSRRRVVEALHRKLVPGGYLLLGHSESLIQVTTAFELVHLKHDMVYRKP